MSLHSVLPAQLAASLYLDSTLEMISELRVYCWLSKSRCQGVLKSLMKAVRGWRGRAASRLPTKAAAVSLRQSVRRASTTSPTMDFSLPLSLTKSFVILFKYSRLFCFFSSNCCQCLPNALDLPLLVFTVNTSLTL